MNEQKAPKMQAAPLTQAPAVAPPAPQPPSQAPAPQPQAPPQEIPLEDLLTPTQRAAMLKPIVDDPPAPAGDLPEWFVVVRGTTLLKKHGFVRARDEHHAREVFLQQAQAVHEERAGLQPLYTETGRAAARAIRENYLLAVGGELPDDKGGRRPVPQQSSEWDIRPADQVRQQWDKEARQRLRDAELSMARR